MTNKDERERYPVKGDLVELALKTLRDHEIYSDLTQIEATFVVVPDCSKNKPGEDPETTEIIVFGAEEWYENLKRNLFPEKSTCQGAEAQCKEIIATFAKHEGYQIVSGVNRLKRKWVSPCYVMFIAAIKQELGQCAELVRFVFQDILYKIDSIEDLKNTEFDLVKYRHYYSLVIEKWILLGRYADHLLQKNQLPRAEFLMELSAETYEQNASKGRIYFTHNGIHTIEKFNEEDVNTRGLHMGNLRMVRKLLEISSRESVFLYASVDSETGNSFITELVQLNEGEEKETEKKEEEKKEDIYIRFSGFLHWSIMCGKQELLSYYHGRYIVNNSSEDRTYEEDLQKLQEIVNFEMLNSLIKILKKQEHGTAVILAESLQGGECEVKRLCEMNRGTQLCSTIEYSEIDGWNEEQILSITSIDGALYMDLEGCCQAIGVLVDGETTIPGDVSRGARYNSIKNYVEQKRCGIYIGIIVSEDGMVNVVSNQFK